MKDKYIPNYSDRRVKRRIIQALIFVKEYFHEHRGRACSRKHIDSQIGKSQNDLGGFLREQLLITTDPRWNKDTGQCKQYSLNLKNYYYLAAQVGYQVEQHLAQVQVNSVNDSEPAYIKYGDLIAYYLKDNQVTEMLTGEFKYSIKTYRHFNPIQNLPRAAKRKLYPVFGYFHNYDISCAAVSIMTQHARHLGLTKPTPTIDHYVQNKRLIRESLAQRTGIPEDKIKQVITGIYAGGKLGYGEHFKMTQELNLSESDVRRLQQDPWIQKYKAEVSMCWRTIKSDLPEHTRLTKSGILRHLTPTSREKWQRYFYEESRVILQIQSFLKSQNQRCFLEHDGWVSESEINLSDLYEHIRCSTGYLIHCEYECYQMESGQSESGQSESG